MLTKTEIPKIGKLYDKLGHALIVLNEDLEIDYFNHCAESAINQLRSEYVAKKWKSIPCKISQKHVFFLLDKDITSEEEVWIKMQISL